MSEKESYLNRPKNLPEVREANRIINKTRNLVKKFAIAEALGLSTPSDKNLAFYYFAQRILQIGIYDVSARRIPIIGNMIKAPDDRNKTKIGAIKILKENVENLIKEKYGSPESIHRSIVIQFALDDLIAQSIVNDIGVTKIDLNKKIVNEWGNAWSPQLNDSGKKL